MVFFDVSNKKDCWSLMTSVLLNPVGIFCRICLLIAFDTVNYSFLQAISSWFLFPSPSSPSPHSPSSLSSSPSSPHFLCSSPSPSPSLFSPSPPFSFSSFQNSVNVSLPLSRFYKTVKYYLFSGSLLDPLFVQSDT